MKILILYYSESGNTKKIAESMFNALKDVHQIELFSIKKAKIENLQNYDLIFLGAPCHHSTLAKKC